jgi:hypothetical protein
MGDSFIFDDNESGQSSFTDMPEGEPSGGDDGSPEGSNNRTFLIVAGVLGGVILLALICMAAYAFLLLPRQRAAQAAQQAGVLATNAAIASGATSTAQALLATPTLDSGSIAATANAVAATRQMQATQTAQAIAAAASPTPVVVEATPTPIVVGTSTPDPVTETVAALYTQAAINELTVVPTQTFAKIHTSNGSSVIVHTDPGGLTLATLANGFLVEVLPEQQTINGTPWAHIRFTKPGDGTVDGWIEQSFLITVTPTPIGAVPTTGFADEVGLPGLFIIGIVLVVIILLSRRLRSTPEAR